MEHYCEGARALKSSLHGEISMESAEQGPLDDLLCVTAGISGVPAEDFSVDELLDFSNGEFEDIEEEEDENEKDVSDSTPSQYQLEDDSKSNSSCYSSQSFLTGELIEPVDEIAELEWVSHFVDDSSCSENSLLYPKDAGTRFELVIKPGLDKRTCHSVFPFPSKPRTKRSGRVWSTGLPLLTIESSSVSSLSSSDSSSSIEPATKKQKKRELVKTGGGLTQRRCSHCQSQKTPQWRTGPLGPKTLCNACGVRYKSGRLLPEYRPACSPTFSGDVHSNSHRKVIEIRRKKELTEPETSLTASV